MQIRRAAPVAVVVAAVLIVVLLRLRADGPAVPNPPRPASSGAAAPAGSAPGGSEASTSTRPTSRSTTKRPPGLSENAADWRNAALDDVTALLRKKGGASALERIAEIARRKPETTRDRLVAAYYTRLIPFVASEDPSTVAAARALALEVVRLPSADSWTRFQALAGIAGVASTRLTTLTLGDDPRPSFVFNIEADYPYARTEWERGPLPSTDLSGLLPELLAGDRASEVRELSATILSRGGGPWAPLERALQTDSDEFVRKTCAMELARQGPASLGALRRAAVDDAEGDVRAAAFQAIGKVAPEDAEQAAFLAQASLEPRNSKVLPDLVEAAFEYSGPAAATVLRPTLVALLTRNAGDPALVSAFVDQAADRGLSEFQPLFRALAAGASADVRADYERGIRKLDEAPRSAELADQIRAGRQEVAALWDEWNRPGTDDARKAEIEAAIQRKVSEIAARREERRR
jgi:hypothetical protein